MQTNYHHEISIQLDAVSQPRALAETNFGVGTLSTTSPESSETAFDISAVFLPMREVARDRSRIINNGVDLQVELPAADELRTLLPSPPLAGLPPKPRHSKSIFSTPRTPLPTTGASAHLPAVSLGGSAVPATCAPAQFPYAPLTPSLSRSLAMSGERGSGHE